MLVASLENKVKETGKETETEKEIDNGENKRNKINKISRIKLECRDRDIKVIKIHSCAGIYKAAATETVRTKAATSFKKCCHQKAKASIIFIVDEIANFSMIKYIIQNI